MSDRRDIHIDEMQNDRVEESYNEQIYTVKEVAEKLELSTSTIRKWEKEMEGILRINRDSNQNRYYTQDDIDQLRKIADLKEEGLNFNAIRKIFTTFRKSVQNQPNYTQSRPTSNEIATMNETTLEKLQESNQELFKNMIQYMETRFKSIEEKVDNKPAQLPAAENLTNDIATVKNDLQDLKGLKTLITNLNDPSKERENRLEQIITIKRIETLLKDEAEQKWKEEPESERTKKVGFFKVEEDLYKKELFIRRYIDSNFEEKLKKEYE
ncbi:helix-turn-helix domain-containing protein [Fictibacillus sp. KIGAM418]|uniref:Helix-turn-helix domain-containing protein n=1 Tax=Fictibacillus marinisediminis TaxID=2878389 RepID=A0A9X1XG52_9BACL|nr:helix-turn-helix domain-containing protein [Fictibacillus marinisediminis]MCK6259546.1 helix-turn-helix domain-containing protein [Fictibacillus marinisediminis]